MAEGAVKPAPKPLQSAGMLVTILDQVSAGSASDHRKAQLLMRLSSDEHTKKPDEEPPVDRKRASVDQKKDWQNSPRGIRMKTLLPFRTTWTRKISYFCGSFSALHKEPLSLLHILRACRSASNMKYTKFIHFPVSVLELRVNV